MRRRGSCKALNDWAELGLDNVVISVNVSARQLSDKCFPEIVKRTLKKHNISLDSEDLYASMNNATVVVVNNSTVGIEAISKLKPLVVLGNCYYDNNKLCLKLNEKKELKKVLKDSLTFTPLKVDVINFLYSFIQEVLIDGHFRDKNLVMSNEVLKRVIKL